MCCCWCVMALISVHCTLYLVIKIFHKTIKYIYAIYPFLTNVHFCLASLTYRWQGGGVNIGSTNPPPHLTWHFFSGCQLITDTHEILVLCWSLWWSRFLVATLSVFQNIFYQGVLFMLIVECTRTKEEFSVIQFIAVTVFTS